MGKKHRPEAEVWWLEFEHPTYGEVKVALRWLHMGRGVFAAKVTAVEFDLFTPAEEQEKLLGMIREAEASLRSCEQEEHHA